MVIAEDARQRDLAFQRVGIDITDAALVAAAIVVDFDTDNAMIEQMREEGILAARLDCPHGGQGRLQLGLDRIGDGGIGRLICRGHGQISSGRRCAASALRG